MWKSYNQHVEKLQQVRGKVTTRMWKSYNQHVGTSQHVEKKVTASTWKSYSQHVEKLQPARGKVTASTWKRLDRLWRLFAEVRKITPRLLGILLCDCYTEVADNSNSSNGIG